MAGAHGVITEGLDVIWKTVDKVPQDDETNFLGYALQVVEFVEHHHWYEETIMFPMMAPEWTSSAIEEHTLFAKYLEEFEHYLHAVLGLEKNAAGKAVASKNAKVPYEKEKLKEIMRNLVGPLYSHLKKEIGYLEPQAIRDSGLPLAKLEKLEARGSKHFASEVDPFTYLVFGVTAVHPSSGFPPAPGFVKKVLVPYVFWWKNKNLWKYKPDFTNDP